MTNQAAQTMPELPVAIASIHADGYWTTDDRRPDWKWPARQRVFSVDQMHKYARDYAAMLAAAPAASGAHPDALPDGTLSKSTAKRVTALAAASVSDRAREIVDFINGRCTNEEAGRKCLGFFVQHGEKLIEALHALEQALTQQRSRPELPPWRQTPMSDLISNLQSMRDRMMDVLPNRYGDQFDGDFDVMLEAINALKRSRDSDKRAEAITGAGDG